MKRAYKFLAFVMTMLLGERVFASPVSSSSVSDADLKLVQARSYLAEGQFEEAREVTSQVLETAKNNSEAQGLMAEIIDQEVQLDKAAGGPNVLSMDNSAKAVEAEKWMERSRSYLALKHYDEAALAAEKVFLYEPYHVQASRLLDQIRDKSLQDGRTAYQAIERISEEEIEARIQNYRSQARGWIEQGKWGSASMAVEKILWLNPFDREATQFKETIQNHSRENEKRKTL